MINPSEINLSSLPWLPLDAKSAFPRNPAIYFAIDSQGTVQYIGRSINPKNRWASHHKYQELETIGSIKIVYLFVDSPELLPQIESALILWFNPPLNTVGKCVPVGIESFSDDTKVVSKLSEYRRSKGLSQDELARLSGLTKTTIQNWENGRNLGAVLRVLKVCQELNVDIRDLFEIEKETSQISKGSAIAS